MRTFSLALTLTWLASSPVSAQTTVTFDPRPAGRAEIEGYTEGGIVFHDVQSPGSVILADTGGIPSNGTAFVAQCGLCRVSLQTSNGGHFDLVAADLGEPLLFGSFGPFATAVTITGTREDGTIVSADVVTDGIAGFEAFFFDDSFSDLASVEFSTPSFFGAISIDNLVVRAGVEKPTLLISPPSGTYVTTQAFDLTLVAVGADAAALLAATLDGDDFTDFLESCATEGRLDSVPGVTLRCPVDGAFFGEGTHILEATVELGDGSTVSDDVSWEILGSSEP